MDKNVKVSEIFSFEGDTVYTRIETARDIIVYINLVLNKTAYVVCCVFWLYFSRYLLRNQRKVDNVVLHTDPKSTTLGPQLIFISNFLEKAPFLAQNA